ncbi:unnamed protein product [Nyctereutes procyonoides]|uniref:(raccoon dog) hypothetical protein n=1 Tax=Nyctereutes procyonoides TaxID=34880 RepID=A0A811Z5Z5_NYCPR|nr:unnamed protein product [Nyctereutes procyonoides]
MWASVAPPASCPDTPARPSGPPRPPPACASPSPPPLSSTPPPPNPRCAPAAQNPEPHWPETLRAGDEGWLVLDVTAASGRWLLGRNKDLGLRLYVEMEDGHSVDPGLAGLLGRRAPRSKQPFLVTFFRASPGPVRAPRAARPLKRRPPKKSNELPHPNRLPGIFDDVHGADGRQVCRRHELYVSFQDLGWLDWVIAPQGYSAYYCEGECSFPLDSCMNATNHAILQSLVSTASVLPGPTGRGLAAPGGWQPRVSGRLCAQELPCVHEQFRAHACPGAGARVAQLCVHLHPHTPDLP